LTSLRRTPKYQFAFGNVPERRTERSNTVDPQVPTDLLYNRDHYWVRMEEGFAFFGVTDHGQNELGDVVHLNLPEVGNEYHALEEIGEVESVMTHTELFTPLSGEVVEVNDALEGAPDLLNRDPYGSGWIAHLKLSDPSEADDLISANDYGHLVEEGE
jgi:glycine cleavage system H protein